MQIPYFSNLKDYIFPLILFGSVCGMADPPISSLSDSQINLVIDSEPTGTGAANVYVNAQIKNQNLQMTLDTGAAKSSIQNSALTEAFKIVGKTSAASVFADNTTDDLIRIPELKIGNLVLTDFVASRARNKKESINLLGLNFFNSRKVAFTFSQSKIEVLSPAMHNANCKSEQTFEVSPAGHVLLPILFPDGSKALALWDTGMSMTLVDSKFFKDHPKLFSERAGAVDISDAKNNLAHVSLLRMEPVKVGSGSGPHIGASTASAVDLARINQKSGHHVDLVMGYSTLSLVDWIIDFPNKRYCILAAEKRE